VTALLQALACLGLDLHVDDMLGASGLLWALAWASGHPYLVNDIRLEAHNILIR
jgi:hypothetical protein